MPNIDETGKRWQESASERIGSAVKVFRKARGMTAVELAERTKQLGFPVTRVAITKIENNSRAGKFDISELLVIAAALGLPPLLLLYPDYPHGFVEVLPLPSDDGRAGQFAAARWFSGEQSLHGIPGQDDDFAITAVDLVQTSHQQHTAQTFMLFSDNEDIVRAAAEQNESLGLKAARLWERLHGEPAPKLRDTSKKGDADA